MAEHIATGAVHHVRLTVTDTNRAREFFIGLLDFQAVGELPAGVAGPASAVLLHNGTTLLVLSPAPERPISGDRFDPNRVGLDHLRLSVANRSALEQAVRLFDQRGIQHGAIVEYAACKISVLPFRGPDDIQLELTAPHEA